MSSELGSKLAYFEAEESTASKKGAYREALLFICEV